MFYCAEDVSYNVYIKYVYPKIISFRKFKNLFPPDLKPDIIANEKFRT